MIIGVIIAGALAYYFLVYKKDTALPPVNTSDPFSIDDQAAYKQMRSLFSEGDLQWVDPLVKKEFDAGNERIKIAGKSSKALAFLHVVSVTNANKDGKFVDKFGAKVIWPQEIYENIWANIRNPLIVRYSAL